MLFRLVPNGGRGLPDPHSNSAGVLAIAQKYILGNQTGMLVILDLWVIQIRASRRPVFV